MSSKTTEVRPGQIWADNDPRAAGRTVEIVKTGLTKERHTGRAGWLVDRREDQPAVLVRTLTPARNVGTAVIGRETLVLLSRFRPTRTGYRLVRDIEVTR